MSPHRLDLEGQPAHERRTDTDSWARLTSTLERYKVFWLLAFAFGGWLGNRITEPLSAVPVLKAQNQAIMARLDTAEKDRKDIAQVLKIFSKVICAGLSSSDRYKYDIDCKELPLPSVKLKGGL
jgi:hypothetical protein